MQEILMNSNVAKYGYLNVRMKKHQPVSMTAYDVAEMLIENGFTIVLVDQTHSSDTFVIMKSYISYKTKTGEKLLMFTNQDTFTIHDYDNPCEVYAYFKKYWSISLEYHACKYCKEGILNE